MKVGGPAAVIRWGYHVAAQVTNWSIERATVTATLAEHDPFRMQQSPLSLVAPNGWRWRLRDVTVSGFALTAQAEEG